jgi:acetyl esterase/lipase
MVCFQALFGTSEGPKSWNITLNLYGFVVRFMMAGGDWMTVRDLTVLYDIIERFRIWWRGCGVERVKRLVNDQIVSGSWIVSKGDILPDVGSREWNDRIVCLWAHGGGYGSGCAITFATGHCEVMDHYNTLSNRPLVYFSLEYPLAPNAKYPAQLDSALSAYYWLINHVGVRHIVLGGDSVGGTLILNLYQQLLKQKQVDQGLIIPKSVVMISPWLDVSLSHTPPDIIESLSATSDFLPLKMLQVWRDNVTPHGMNPRDPRISPFFDLSPFKMPEDGLLLIYGSTEVFAPTIDDWVKSIRKDKEARSKLKVIQGH